MIVARPFFAAVLGTLALACTSSGSTAQPAKEPVATTQAQALKGCPFGVSDTEIAIADTPDGVSMTFLSPTNVADLRERVGDAAAMHGPGERVGKGHGGKHGEGGRHGLKAMQLPAMRAVAEDVEGGAKLVLVPADPADLGELRAKVRARAKDMAGSCD